MTGERECATGSPITPANAAKVRADIPPPPADLPAPSIDVPLPEELPPVTNADFAPAAPASTDPSPAEAPKRAGDAA